MKYAPGPAKCQRLAMHNYRIGMYSVLPEHLRNERNHLLFLIRTTLGDEESERRERGRIYIAASPTPNLPQKPHK